MISTDPPAFSILFLAFLLIASIFTVRAASISPSPKILIKPFFFANPFSLRESGLISPSHSLLAISIKSFIDFILMSFLGSLLFLNTKIFFNEFKRTKLSN